MSLRFPPLVPCVFTVLCLAGATAQAIEPAPPLGRLFMTPQWRATLERQREFNIQETRSLEGDSMRLDGVVVRSSGKNTVWVNSRPQPEGGQENGVFAKTSPQQPGRATLATGAEPPADLKVGTTLDRSTRDTADGLADGIIKVNPPVRE